MDFPQARGLADAKYTIRGMSFGFPASAGLAPDGGLVGSRTDRLLPSKTTKAAFIAVALGAASAGQAEMVKDVADDMKAAH